MSRAEPSNSFCIGWDVGGWNCDRNPSSRDAIAILDSGLAIVGQPWRGNLRECINTAATPAEFLRGLFSRCNAAPVSESAHVTLAIDTPLGFSDEFVELVQRSGHVADPVEDSDTNRYLFRRTERFLFAHGLRPLSPVKDMIGSQATKGMHVLAKFAPRLERCGVWSDGGSLLAIEAYPAACKGSAAVEAVRRRVGTRRDDHQDKQDALTCAIVACLFGNREDDLAPPGDDVPASEGWIWVPRDALRLPTGRIRLE